MDRTDIGSWIGGPVQAEDGHRGQRLGLPADGPGSMAGTMSRVVALMIDWITALVLARALIDSSDPQAQSVLTLVVFAVQVALLTWLAGASFGQRIVGIRVLGRGRRLTPVGAALRTLLICLVIPPLIWDADGRGLHDRAVDSVVVRGR